jgi:HemY protein
MKLLFVGLLVLLATVAAVLFAQQDSGQVMIAYRDWSVESSLVLFVAALLILFAILYLLLRFTGGILSLPRRLARWRRRRREARVRHSYLRGMTALAEGRWIEAEKWLLKEVAHSDKPALHYLAAAQAAEAQGSLVRRDSYLRAATQHDPDAEVAAGLAQAGYYLQHHQAGDARTVLGRLHVAQPKHPVVLKRLMQAYLDLKEWQSLLDILPDLEKRGAVTAVHAEELQCMAYHGLIREAGRGKDKERLHQLWQQAPRAVRRNEDVLFDYARLLIAADPESGAELDALITDAIQRRWSDALVYAYGLIASPNPGGQLSQAERWLKHHSTNAVLLLTLGRLSVRNQLWGKARSYLEASLGVDPQAETYRELGALLERLNNKGAALECYRKALTLVPDKNFAALVQAQQPLLLPLLR